jgi:hypothetical protein
MTRLAIAAEAIKIHLSEATAAEGTVDGLLHRGRSLSLPFRLTRPQLDELIRGYVDRTIELTRNVLTTAGLEPARSPRWCASAARPASRWCGGAWPSCSAASRPCGSTPTRWWPRARRSRPAACRARCTAAAAWRPATRCRPRRCRPLAHGDVPWAQAAAPARPILLDVTPATLRIATAGGFSEPILDKNLPTPIERTRVFTTAHDHQRRVVIECGRGEAQALRRERAARHAGARRPAAAPARRGEDRGDVPGRHRRHPDVRARDADTGASCDADLTILGAPTRGAA